MIYKVEKDAKDFEFWDGAREFMVECEKRGVAGEVYRLLNDMFDDGSMYDETDINDYVRFETDDICMFLWGITEEDFWNQAE